MDVRVCIERFKLPQAVCACMWVCMRTRVCSGRRGCRWDADECLGDADACVWSNLCARRSAKHASCQGSGKPHQPSSLATLRHPSRPRPLPPHRTWRGRVRPEQAVSHRAGRVRQLQRQRRDRGAVVCGKADGCNRGVSAGLQRGGRCGRAAAACASHDSGVGRENTRVCQATARLGR
jgi:hypothetical protein